MNRPEISGGSNPGNRPGQGSDAAQTGSDRRIRELEQAKQQLEAELANVRSGSAGPPRLPVPTSASDATDTDPPTEENGGSFLRSRQIPAWAISTMVHILILLVLGLFKLYPAAANYAITVTAEDFNEPLAQLAEFDLSPELENMKDISSSFDSPQLDQSEMSEPALDSSATDASDFGPQVIEQDSTSQINSIFSEDGSAMKSLSDQVGKMTADFFGSKAKGRRFVFVVDNSNSMTRGRFHTALNELVRTVEQMESDQYFYVIFFSDTAYPLFWPSPVSQLVPATPKNKERLQRWLYTVELCLHTRGEAALQMALSLNPDAIYVLGDGAFTDSTTQALTSPHRRRTPIFTLGMEVNQRGKDQLTTIARANNGTYRLVSVAPGAAQAAKQSPVKKNNTRGPIWGVKLPLQKKKKK